MKKIIATFGRDNFVMLRNLIAEAACFNNSERITEVFAGYFRIPDGSPFRKEFQQGHRKNSEAEPLTIQTIASKLQIGRAHV